MFLDLLLAGSDSYARLLYDGYDCAGIGVMLSRQRGRAGSSLVGIDYRRGGDL